MKRVNVFVFLGLFLCFVDPARAQLSEAKVDEMAGEALAELETDGFSFSFEDLEGKVVGSDDKRFEGKVLLVDLMGSWCRPCRLEAPFLEKLYDTYREQGLEIVSIAFEFGDDKAKNLKKAKKFKDTFDTKFLMLYGGTTKGSFDVLPRKVANLGFPVVIAIDRKGVVRSVEAGFWDKSAENIEGIVRKLIGEDAETGD
jgi:thiol-disulfide isomerase/thioredoxin